MTINSGKHRTPAITFCKVFNDFAAPKKASVPGVIRAHSRTGSACGPIQKWANHESQNENNETLSMIAKKWNMKLIMKYVR